MSPELQDHIRREIEAWKHSQDGQTSAYDFEKSFVETWMRLGREVLQEELGPLPKSRNQKKRSRRPSANSPAPKHIR